MGLKNPQYDYFAGDTLFDMYQPKSAQMTSNVTTIDSFGEGQGTGITRSFNANSTTRLVSQRLTTSTSVNTGGGVVGQLIGCFAAVGLVTFIVSLPSITNITFWAGLSNSPGNFVNSDNPTGDYMGFRFSTTASDSTWQCANKDNVTQKITNSGVSVFAGGLYYLQIYWSTAKITYYINGKRYVQHTQNLPRTSVTTFCYGMQVTTRLAGTAKSFDSYGYRERRVQTNT